MKESDFTIRSAWVTEPDGEAFVAVAKTNATGRVIATARLQVSITAQDFMDHFGDGKDVIERTVLGSCRDAALRFPA